MTTDIRLTFLNDYQRKFFFATERNQCFGGGFGDGKTYAGCEGHFPPPEVSPLPGRNCQKVLQGLEKYDNADLP